MLPGPYLFLPNDSSGPLYAMVSNLRAYTSGYVSFFRLDGRRFNRALPIPISIAKRFGKFVPMVCAVGPSEFRAIGPAINGHASKEHLTTRE